MIKLFTLGFLFFCLNSYALNVSIQKTPFEGATLYVPQSFKDSPGLILFHGSEGGTMMFSHVEAMLYASNGITSLVYCYLDCKGSISSKRQVLEQVSLDKVAEAVKWLKNSKYLGKKKVGLYGYSRGAELVSVYASSIDPKSEGEVDALLLQAATDQVESPFSWDWRDDRCWICTSNKSDCPKKEWNVQCGVKPKKYSSYVKDPTWIFRKKEYYMNMPINLMGFPGKIFLTHGTDDKVWDVERSKRLLKNVKKEKVEAHFFEGEGHVFSPDETNRRRELALKFMKENLK